MNIMIKQSLSRYNAKDINTMLYYIADRTDTTKFSRSSRFKNIETIRKGLPLLYNMFKPNNPNTKISSYNNTRLLKPLRFNVNESAYSTSSMSLFRAYRGFKEDGEMIEADYEALYYETKKKHNMIAATNILLQRRRK